MQDANNLKNELQALEQRRGDVAAQLETARADLEQARSGFLDGTGDTEAMTTAQARATALQEAQAQLNQRIEAIRAEIPKAQTAEKRESQVKQLAELAEAARAEAAELNREFEAALQALDAAAHGIVERSIAIAQKQNQALNMARVMKEPRENLLAEIGNADALRDFNLDAFMWDAKRHSERTAGTAGMMSAINEATWKAAQRRKAA
jgi:DNA repair exonuclease SbcCD ATPase subunit